MRAITGRGCRRQSSRPCSRRTGSRTLGRTTSTSTSPWAISHTGASSGRGCRANASRSTRTSSKIQAFHLNRERLSSCSLVGWIRRRASRSCSRPGRCSKTRPGFTIIGDGDLADVVIRATESNARIRYLGRLPRAEVLQQLRGAQALVLPSRWYEGFPLTIVEAFACGVSVIASQMGSMIEIVDHGRTGLLFHTGDAIDLAKQVTRVAASPVQTRGMGVQARREYQSNYTADGTKINFWRSMSEQEQFEGNDGQPGMRSLSGCSSFGYFSAMIHPSFDVSGGSHSTIDSYSDAERFGSCLSQWPSPRAEPED